MTANETGTESLHTPYVRSLRNWRQDDLGRWVSTEATEELWEIVCAQCGDDQGPVDRQMAAVRSLRGPYSSRDRAEHVARRHVMERDKLS